MKFPKLKLTDREIAKLAMFGTIVSAAMSMFAVWQSNRQFTTDYDPAIVFSPGELPIKQIPSSKPAEVVLTLFNTSKSNITYSLSAESNLACVTGENAKPILIPCRFQSGPTTISKSDGGKNSNGHRILISAPVMISTPDIRHALAVSTGPDYYVQIQVIDENTGKILSHSRCYYEYWFNSKSLRLFAPVMVVDPSGEVQNLQAECHG